MKLDKNIYPDAYPIFNKTRQYLIRNHVASLSTKSTKPIVTNSPGFKRQCEISHNSNHSPSTLSEMGQNKPNSALGNYQISYYPTSPLNPELEEQCMMLHMFKNRKKFDHKKTKIKTPVKLVRKVRKLRFDADISSFHNFSAFACKKVVCPQCLAVPCECGVHDKIVEDVQRRILTSPIEKSSKIPILPRTENKKDSDHMQFGFKAARKRKHRPLSFDFEAMRRDLLITPLNGYI